MMRSESLSTRLPTFFEDPSLGLSKSVRDTARGTTATATLTRFIELYLNGELDNLDVDKLGDRFDEQVRAIVDEYLEQHLPSYLDKYLALSQG